MEFKVDPGQDGKLLLKRHVSWEEQIPRDMERDSYYWLWTFSVTGLAGAVSLQVLAGNHRNGRGPVPEGAPPATQYALGDPVGVVSRPEEMVVADMASAGLHVHAYRPLPDPDSTGPHPCELLEGGECYSKQLEPLSQTASTSLLMALAQPGGVSAVWEALEETWRDEFVPALSRVAQAREAARLAEAQARGAAFAQRMAPDVVPVSRSELLESGLALSSPPGTEMLLRAEVDVLYLPREWAEAHGLRPSRADGQAATPAEGGEVVDEGGDRVMVPGVAIDLTDGHEVDVAGTGEFRQVMRREVERGTRQNPGRVHLYFADGGHVALDPEAPVTVRMPGA